MTLTLISPLQHISVTCCILWLESTQWRVTALHFSPWLLLAAWTSAHDWFEKGFYDFTCTFGCTTRALSINLLTFLFLSLFFSPPAQEHNAAHQPPDQPRHQRVSVPPPCSKHASAQPVLCFHELFSPQMNKSEQREKFPVSCRLQWWNAVRDSRTRLCSEVNRRRKWISLEAISSHFQDLQLHKNLQSPVNHPPLHPPPR